MPRNDVADISSLLELCAELALGFLAFSAVIMTLSDQRLRDGPVRDIAAGLLHVPTILLIASVTPLIIGYGLSLEPIDWRIGSAILLVVWVVDFANGVRERTQQTRSALVFEISFATVFFHLPIFANVVGWYASPSFGYAVGIGVLLLASAIIFVRLARMLIATGRYDSPQRTQ